MFKIIKIIMKIIMKMFQLMIKIEKITENENSAKEKNSYKNQLNY